MTRFKKGDTVRRIRTSYGNLKVGDVRVVHTASSKFLYFKGDYTAYHAMEFELVDFALNSPVLKVGDTIKVRRGKATIEDEITGLRGDGVYIELSSLGGAIQLGDESDGYWTLLKHKPNPVALREGKFGWATLYTGERIRGFVTRDEYGNLGFEFFGGWSSDISNFVEDPFTEEDLTRI